MWIRHKSLGLSICNRGLLSLLYKFMTRSSIVASVFSMELVRPKVYLYVKYLKPGAK